MATIFVVFSVCVLISLVAFGVEIRNFIKKVVVRFVFRIGMATLRFMKGYICSMLLLA